jgi:dihydrofolate synthase/folylpolyglutamate synthase
MFEWLEWIGSVHKTDIDLGLERISEVAARLNLLTPACRVITVGGTNGKGSVVAGLEAIYLAAGYRVGAFTSPYLFQHNEEVRLNGVMADDTSFCLAFEEIESARAHVSLTPFEWHTLAALLIFAEAKLDIMILEVGLGGRLDAVNIIDADVAVVASIGIDHTAWLGDTRELIAIEKAGIFRHGRPAVCGDVHPPTTLPDAADKIGARFYQQGKDFHYTEAADSWAWQAGNTAYDHLPRTSLLTQNMSTVLMAVTLMQPRLPVQEEAIRRALQTVTLPGRIQIVTGPVIEIFDVSHNPAAAEVLAHRLHTMRCAGKTVAVFSMLDDKDIAGTIAAMRGVIDEWYVAPLTCKRAATIEKLRRLCEGVTLCSFYESITAAYQAAHQHTEPGDRIVIFGSFYTVAAVLSSGERRI